MPDPITVPKDYEAKRQWSIELPTGDQRALAIDEEAQTVELSFASEVPYQRYFGLEVLGCKKSEVDLHRMQDGAAVMVEHHSDQVGVVDSVTIDTTGKKLRAKLRFSKRSDYAKQVFGEIVDGIRRNVSVGYKVNEMKLVKSNPDGIDEYRVTNWMPYEISIVAVPADETVGVGRAHEPSPHNNPPPNGATPKPQENRTMPPTPTATEPAAPQIDVVAERATAAKEERQRAKEIKAIAANLRLAPEFAAKHIDDGTPLDDFRIKAITEAGGKKVTESPDIGVSQKDLKRYSLCRAMAAMGSGRKVDGLEAELSQEVAKRTGKSPEGFFVPHDVLTAPIRRRALNAETPSAGGYLVTENDAGQGMIELLRAMPVVSSMGARVLTGLMGNIAIPSKAGGATAYWLSETGSITTSNQTFAQVGMTPKRLGAQTAYTLQLLAQASVDVESMVREELMEVLALALDLAAIDGDGNAEPLGILNTTGINTVTFGAAATWAKVVSFETEVSTDNALRGSMGWITSPGVRGKWRSIDQATGAARWLWGADNAPNGYPAAVTSQMPGNKVIFGNWQDLIIGLWDGMDIVVDPYTLASNGQRRVVINQLANVACRHAVSFCASTDSGAQ